MICDQFHKSADLMAVSSIAKASAQPDFRPNQVAERAAAGLNPTSIPMSGVVQLSDRTRVFRRVASGCGIRRQELLSVRKGAFLRLSDFINEYDSPTTNTGQTTPGMACMRCCEPTKATPI